MKLMQNLRGLEIKEDKELAMVVSLSHTIYFYHVEKFRANQWIFTEMATL
jgi:acyl-CoA thioesterase